MVSASTATALAAKTADATRVPAPVKALAVDPRFGNPTVGDRLAYAEESGRVYVFTKSWFGLGADGVEEGEGRRARERRARERRAREGDRNDAWDVGGGE